MQEFSSTVASHVRFLIRSLNGSNSDSVLQELRQFSDYGLEGSILTLQSCLDYINIYENEVKNDHLHPAFASLFRFILGKPNFSSILCQSLRHVAIREGFLDDLSNLFCLSLSEKIAVGLALSESENSEARLVGTNFCMTHVESLFDNPSILESDEQIQNIFMFLHRCEGLSKHVDTFTQMLSLMQPKEAVPSVLGPMILDELNDTKLLRNMDLFYDSNDDFDSLVAEMEKEISMADVMKELGYGCSTDASKCKEILSLYLPLTEVTVARILGTVVRTHAGLEDSSTAFSAFLSAIGSNAMFELPRLSSWNVNILVDSIKQLAPDTNWVKVMENLDHEGFYISSEDAFSFFMTIYKCACQELFPIHAICGSVWKNSEGQLSFLKYAVSMPPEIFTFSHSIRKLAYVDVHGLSSQLGQSNNAWLCLDLLDVLCQLAERGHAATIQSMLEHPLKHCPEVLLLGIAQIHTTYNLLQHEVSSNALPRVIANASRKGFILHLWHINHNLVLRGFVDTLTKDPDSVHRILDICQENKIINLVLERIPFSLAIRLAAVAFQKELLDFEKWLNDNIIISKEAFFEECLKYVKEIQLQTVSDDAANRLHHTTSAGTLGFPTARIILKVLEANAQTLTLKSLSDEIGEMLTSVENHHSSQHSDGVIDSSSSNSYSEDIESEANSYFQRMFAEQQSIDEMVQMLARFKESSVKREQSIFDCMISNLFEEYRFFPKYPEKQLGLAAILFGCIIKHQLVTHLPLGIALRCVLDALRKPADSKMFAFGTKALEQFISRLEEWPQYCNHILQISHLRSTHPNVVEYIDGVLARKSHGGNGPVDQLNISSLGTTVNELIGSNSSHPGQQLSSSLRFQPRQSALVEEGAKASTTMNSFTKPPIAASVQPTATSSADSVSLPKLQSAQSAPGMLSISSAFSRNRGSTTRFGSALNIETLEAAAERRETPIEAPSSEVQDKISFIINNISSANVETKAKEFSEILKEQYYPWFAQYMVMKRASIEPNFHELYLKFLDKFNSKALNKEIVQATYENCKVLLGSDLIKSSSEERSLLKNLGSWLGKLTIGRNQVLRARDIDPKSLVIEAYEKGLMIAVIPFTSKILEPCQSSLAYQPPNPWTMGILALLAEIYAMPNLKMNLKFDIEVLFKNLGVLIKDVTPSSLLRERVRVIEGNPDFSNKDVGVPQPTVDEKSMVLTALNQVELPLEYGTTAATLVEDDNLSSTVFSDPLPSAPVVQQPTQTQSSYVGQLPSSVPNIGSHFVVNPKLQNLGPHFQRVLPVAMDRAYKEIVNGIVQRSVSIATQTTKELVIKDYAFESDESRIFNAAHLMVASLAGSLAHVTCKEPLRASISSQLRNLLQGLAIGDMLEQTVQLVTNDNLDLGCALIENAATERAVQMIDGEISQQLSLRRKHRENVGSSMYDASIYAQGMGVLPETLRPTPGRLSDSQQRVYQDFVRLPWQNQQSIQTANATHLPSLDGGNFPLTISTSSGQISSSVYPSGLGNSSFGVGAPHIDLVPEEMEKSQAQLFSPVALNHIRSSENSVPFRSEADSMPLSSLSAPNLEAQSVEPVPSEPVGSSQLPSLSSASLGTGLSEPMATEDALDKYHMLALKLDAALANDNEESDIQAIIVEVPKMILKCGNRDEAALAVAQKVFKALYETGGNSFHVNAHLAILASIRDVCKLVVKELTTWVIYSDEERKFNRDITVGLIRRELLNLAEYNIHLTKLLDAGRNKAATEFAVSLLQTLKKEEPKVISELQNLLEALAKLATRPGSPESLQLLVEIVKNPAATASGLPSPVTAKDDKNRLTRDKKVLQSMASRGDTNNVEVMEPEASSFQQQVSTLFAEWYRISELPAGNDAPCTKFMLHLHQIGLLRGDDKTERFFRVLLEISVSHFGELMQKSPQVHTPFLAIDIYAKLVYSILKYWPVDQGSSKLFLLPKILTVTVRSIQKDADEKKEDFNPRPYFRLFINWLLDIGSIDVHDGVNFQVLSFFANAFHALQPLKVPGFSFAWLELVSHRTFMPKLLTGNAQKGWPLLHRLLMDLFQFMEPFLRNAELGELIRILYKGTLRVLLVLLHDFPEFLCDYHFSFCDVIPSSCIQMRNIILSAFPCNMRLPDPSTPNLKIDLLAEMSQAPRILSDVDAALKAKQMKADVDEYLRTKQGPLLKELKHRLLLSPNEVSHAGTRYNVPLINSVVLYVGMQAIQLLQARNRSQTQSGSADPSVDNAALAIFESLIKDLDTEGRYLFLNAIANQLRYPNTHTHYFSFIMLHLFSQPEKEIIKEQITRVLLERLIVNRPHPWGLLITFIELIKNPSYYFWSQSFTRCAPEIEKLFESVSRSCGGPKPVNENMVGSGALSDGVH
ncbi:uncharacterized protein LOC141585978 isoform X2 [Silene latifolia]|uniref:uncharacterized protein LOC141585978 isoform X2 n=1 Tax=Silene latifolia TaxID=37657 RepID=UPI003D770902